MGDMGMPKATEKAAVLSIANTINDRLAEALDVIKEIDGPNAPFDAVAEKQEPSSTLGEIFIALNFALEKAHVLTSELYHLRGKLQ